MKKTTRLIALALLAFILTVSAGYYDAVYRAPKRLKIRYETVSSSKIPENISGLQIVFFSDIHYNRFMDHDRLAIAIDKINSLHPDVIVFAGDLFDHPAYNIPSEDVQNQLIEQLSLLNAPLGKFAVFGNHDVESAFSIQICQRVLAESNFELLRNRTIQLHNKGTESINLVGLDNPYGELDITKAFAPVIQEAYTITVCHTPDIIEQVPNTYVDLMISGHSHGGQITLPLIGPIIRNRYAEKYVRGKHKVNHTILDITKGIGTTRYDARLFADPEIVIYLLQSK